MIISNPLFDGIACLRRLLLVFPPAFLAADGERPDAAPDERFDFAQERVVAQRTARPRVGAELLNRAVRFRNRIQGCFPLRYRHLLEPVA